LREPYQYQAPAASAATARARKTFKPRFMRASMYPLPARSL
jgi:hypothetical protein